MLGLKYKADERSLAILVMALLAIYLPFFYFIPSYLILVWIYASSWLCTLVLLINHNHQHCHTFKHKSINLLFDLLMTAVFFFPSCMIYLSHNINHHHYAGGKQDWIGVRIAGLGSGFERLLRYYVSALWQLKKAKSQPDLPSQPTHIINTLKLERIMLVGLILGLLYIDWAATVLFVLLPSILGGRRLFEYNHILHDNGCQFDQLERCSHNVTSKLANWFYFNGGFHTAHHAQPQLHWSLLPQLHDELKQKIPSHYIHHSATFFYVSYLLSNKRQLEEG